MRRVTTSLKIFDFGQPDVSRNQRTSFLTALPTRSPIHADMHHRLKNDNSVLKYGGGQGCSIIRSVTGRGLVHLQSHDRKPLWDLVG